jgi:hypothetical protein
MTINLASPKPKYAAEAALHHRRRREIDFGVNRTNIAANVIKSAVPIFRINPKCVAADSVRIVMAVPFPGLEATQIPIRQNASHCSTGSVFTCSIKTPRGEIIGVVTARA